jgi:hypothetical protein
MFNREDTKPSTSRRIEVSAVFKPPNRSINQSNNQAHLRNLRRVGPAQHHLSRPSEQGPMTLHAAQHDCEFTGQGGGGLAQAGASGDAKRPGLQIRSPDGPGQNDVGRLIQDP